MAVQEATTAIFRTNSLKRAFAEFDQRRELAELSTLLSKPEFQQSLLTVSRQLLMRLRTYFEGTEEPYKDVEAIIIGNWVLTDLSVEHFDKLKEVKGRYARFSILHITRDKDNRD
ncbi:hypothetical protein KBD71_05615 [Candidatus Woesebacteria bacterium]|nr:hypothetical protein [Candidatus Woesebacteria bacterium]